MPVANMELANLLIINGRANYGGLEASELQRIKELEAENSRWKKMYADRSLVNDALKDAMAKKL